MPLGDYCFCVVWDSKASAGAPSADGDARAGPRSFYERRQVKTFLAASCPAHYVAQGPTSKSFEVHGTKQGVYCNLGRIPIGKLAFYYRMAKPKQIGTVTHWYDKLGVAVVKLTSKLSKGDTVKVKKGEEEFEDIVSSLQIDHKDVVSAKKGDDAAIKLSQRAKEGSGVYSAD